MSIIEKKVRIKHNVCGHVWEITPDRFLNGNRCPECMNVQQGLKKRITHDEFIDRVQGVHGSEYTVLSKYNGVDNSIKIQHDKCGYNWITTPYRLINGIGCLRCNASRGEKVLFELLNNLKFKFIHQKSFEDCRNKKMLPFDFYIEDTVLIEFDGEFHFYDKIKKFESVAERYHVRFNTDVVKNNYCTENEIPFLRIPYWESHNIEKLATDFLKKHGLLQGEIHDQELLNKYTVDSKFDHKEYTNSHSVVL